jgi:hypothetical protein
LYSGITRLLAGYKDFADEIYKHPLIYSGSSRGNRPSYVEARNFTLALWHTAQTKLAGSAKVDPLAAPADALNGLIKQIKDFAPTDAAGLAVRSTLVSLLTAAGNDYEKLLQVTDQWFDAQMDRVAGWYKRNAQYVLIGISIFVVALGGVDSTDIATKLFASPEATHKTAGAVTDAFNKNKNDQTKADQAIAKVVQDTELTIFHPPWNTDEYKKKTTPATGYNPKSYSERLPGILLTIIAVSLGAPFWFDLLKCIINVRMAGQRPDDVPSPSKQSAPGPTVVVNQPAPTAALIQPALGPRPGPVTGAGGVQ